MKRLSVLLLLFAVTVLAYAHNGMEHVMGTINALTATSLDVKTTKGDTRTLVVNGTTKWMKGPNAIAPTDAKVGDRVVVHAKPVDGKLVAAEVEIGTGHKK